MSSNAQQFIYLRLAHSHIGETQAFLIPESAGMLPTELLNLRVFFSSTALPTSARKVDPAPFMDYCPCTALVEFGHSIPGMFAVLPWNEKTMLPGFESEAQALRLTQFIAQVKEVT